MSGEVDLRYPIGRWQRIVSFDAAGRKAAIASLEALPEQVRNVVRPLGERELERAYRPGGWTIRQLAHHLPDSHMNAYIRMKLALTEDQPAVKTYHEELWAKLADTAATPVSVSLDLLAALHARWVALLRGLPAEAFARGFAHPEWGSVSIDVALSQYEWHGLHHLAHMRQALR